MNTIQIQDVELANKLADLRRRVEIVDATGRVVAWFDPNRGGEQKPIIVDALNTVTTDTHSLDH